MRPLMQPAGISVSCRQAFEYTIYQKEQRPCALPNSAASRLTRNPQTRIQRKLRDVCVDGECYRECFNRATGAWQRVRTADDLLLYDADGNLPPPTRRLQ